jgi:predicted metal-dependent hydrolase
MRPKRLRTRKKAEELKGEVKFWASRIGVEPRRVQIQRMTRKWASCSNSGQISLSKDLLREDAGFQEVVIVHELLHLLVPNHGKLFKGLMTAYLPDWDEKTSGRISELCGYQAANGRQESIRPPEEST